MIVSIYFIGGLLLANMGVLGLYMGKIYNEVRERPLYIVPDLVNFDQPTDSVLALTHTLSERQTCK